MSHILIVGGGFAGVWAAASAAKLRNESGAGEDALSITLVAPSDDMVIRPRLYEAAPHTMRVPLDEVLGPIGVRRVAATVVGIDTDAHSVTAVHRDGLMSDVAYDRLVLASGSRVVRPDVIGAEHLFDVDSMQGAAALDSHLNRLPGRADSDGQYTAVVVGAGFTGLEIATELTGRLRELAGKDAPVRVVLVEREPEVGPELGAGPRPVIQGALDTLGVEVRLNVSLGGVTSSGATLSDGTLIPASTVIWTCGMAASPLTRLVDGTRDAIGRLSVDQYLRVDGVADVFAAGDTAAALATEGRVVTQSCQHALPQGKFVGHNVAADLLGLAMVGFEPVPYVTCLDLGPFGSVVTSGWDREVIMSGPDGKDLKRTINAEWIYPPMNDAAALLEAAGPNPEWPEYTPRAQEPVGFGRAAS